MENITLENKIQVNRKNFKHDTTVGKSYFICHTRTI